MRQLIRKQSQITGLVLLLSVCSAGAENAPVGTESLAALIQLGLAKSAAGISAKSDVRLQEAAENAAGRTQYVPQISLGASYQQFKYDRLHDDGTGNLISNDGHNTSVSLQCYTICKNYSDQMQGLPSRLRIHHVYKKKLLRAILSVMLRRTTR